MSEWIKLNGANRESYPPARMNVLLYTRDGWRAEGEYRENSTGRGYWVQYRWNTILPYEEVTHWMPLPAPPSGDDGGKTN